MRVCVWALVACYTAHAVQFPSVWYVLGPFPQGSREKSVDPLYASHDQGVFGLVHQQWSPELSRRFPSEYGDNGTVSWRIYNSSRDNSVSIDFPGVRFKPIQDSLGNAVAGMFNGWAVADLDLEESDGSSFMVSCSGIREYYFDSSDRRILGDEYGKQSLFFPVYLENSSGHKMFVRISGDQSTSFSCEFKPVPVSNLWYSGDLFVPDIVNGQFTSDLMSFSVVNCDNTRKFFPLTVSCSSFAAEFLPDQQVSPLQTQALLLKIRLEQFHHSTKELHSSCVFTGSFENSFSAQAVSFDIKIDIRPPSQPYKFVFQGLDLSAQYAVLIRPEENCGSKKCPILLSTHGAGVPADEISNPAWAYAYQRQNRAWILLPTNRDRYGFDWQGPGRGNVEAAIQYFVENLPGVSYEERSEMMPDPTRILFAGHSMGGHGCWLLSSQNPDTTVAAAPAAGWLSMDLYSPMFTRTSYNYIDSQLRGILESNLGESNAALHAPKLKGIPVIARMGSLDDNVNPFHMRRMVNLQTLQGGDALISEVPGRGHWWGGVVDDDEMQSFFEAHLYNDVPSLPEKFSFVCMNPRFCGSRGGLKVIQQIHSYQMSRFDVEQLQDSWKLKTRNVRRLRLVNSFFVLNRDLIIGRQKFASQDLESSDLCFNEEWRLCRRELSEERTPLTYGTVSHALLGPLVFVYSEQHTGSQEACNWIASNWYYQGHGASITVSDSEFLEDISRFSRFNWILVGNAFSNRAVSLLQSSRARNSNSDSFHSLTAPVPTRWLDNEGDICLSVGGHPYCGNISTLYIGPQPFSREERLAVVVGGTNALGVRISSDFFPTKSSETIPDALVLDSMRAQWQGLGSTLGAWSWSFRWDIDYSTSYFG